MRILSREPSWPGPQSRTGHARPHPRPLRAEPHRTGKLAVQLAALDTGATSPASDPALIDLLPELAGSLADLPADIQAELFAPSTYKQILWNPAMKQATFHATITDTTPGIVAALLTRAGDDSTTTSPAPGTATATTATSTNPAPARSSGQLGVPFVFLSCEKRSRTYAERPMIIRWFSGVPCGYFGSRRTYHVSKADNATSPAVPMIVSHRSDCRCARPRP
jgi:hypothetical protein